MQTRLPPRDGATTAHRLRILATLGALVAIVSLALPASALASRFTIKAHIANHTPVVNKKWPVELTITRGKTKLSGTVVYEFMFDGSVVATRPKHGAYKFKNGVYRDEMVFTKDSVGEPITLRFVVKTKYGTEHLDWAIHAKAGATTTKTGTTTTGTTSTTTTGTTTT